MARHNVRVGTVRGASPVQASGAALAGGCGRRWERCPPTEGGRHPQCRVATWIEPAFHLAWSDAALRGLDHRLAERHLRMHELEGAATRWFNLQPMHAELIATFGRLWDDPQRVLAQFDSILADAGLVQPTSPWRAHLLRLRAELLIDMGELNRAAQLVEDLLEHGDPAVAVVPAARLHLAAGDHAQAVARADEGIFSLEVSLADRAHLYAIKAAALHLARADHAEVAVAAAAACVVGEQAMTLLPFALLPSGLRAELWRTTPTTTVSTASSAPPGARAGSTRCATAGRRSRTWCASPAGKRCSCRCWRRPPPCRRSPTSNSCR